MSRKLERRFDRCDEQLDSFFNGLKLTSKFHRQLQEIKQFYRNACAEADEAEEIVAVYERFIEYINQVKNNEMTLDKALEEIKKIAQARKLEARLDTFLQGVCLTLLLVMATFFFLSLCVLVAPTFSVNPFLGLFVLTLMTQLFVQSLTMMIMDFVDFRSTDFIYEEHKRENKVLNKMATFFQPKSKDSTPDDEATEELEHSATVSC
jgi:exonuclease VII small subunit